MKKILLAILASLFLSGSALAAVPQTNKLVLGDISSELPNAEMRAFYAKMEPIMRKIFGPPFSNVNLKIEADLEGTEHGTGYKDKEQTLVLAGQAKQYSQDKSSDPTGALQRLESSMLHELSHGMYYYGNDRYSFNPQWINEGWAKVQEEIMMSELLGKGLDANPYFAMYGNKDTIAGTRNWGSSKQRTNHSLVYNITTATHLTLLAAASTSNDDLDFMKKMNERLYSELQQDGETNISLDKYQRVMKELLAGKTVDGQDAYTWYFDNPNSLTEGSSGSHLGITTDGGKITAYAFDREAPDSRGDTKENPISGTKITITVQNSDGEQIIQKTVDTDANGNSEIDLPRTKSQLSNVLSIIATANIAGKDYKASTFYFDAPRALDRLMGTLIDEDGNPLPGKYIGLLTSSDATFEYKDQGVFSIKVPKNQRTVNLEFLGIKQEVTKGPFQRMFAMTIPKDVVAQAALKSDAELKAGIVKPSQEDINTTIANMSGKSKEGHTISKPLAIGLISLVIVLGIIAIIAMVRKNLSKNAK